MRHWLPRALRALREEYEQANGAKLKLVRIGAQANLGESTISRFEAGETWSPQNNDRIVAAYAAELGLESVDIWARAVELWRESEFSGGGTSAGAGAAVSPSPGGLPDPAESGLVPPRRADRPTRAVPARRRSRTPKPARGS